MSLYGVDKLLREVILSDEARDSFQVDPSASIDGRDITASERDALIGRKYVELYDAGVHPFLLNCFATRFWPLNEFFARQLAYSEELQGHGYPDFST